MFKRIRKAWKISKQLEDIVDDVAIDIELPEGGLRKGKLDLKVIEPLGDGKAVFFSGEPTPEEELEYQREQAGTLPWYKRLKNML